MQPTGTLQTLGLLSIISWVRYHLVSQKDVEGCSCENWPSGSTNALVAGCYECGSAYHFENCAYK